LTTPDAFQTMPNRYSDYTHNGKESNGASWLQLSLRSRLFLLALLLLAAWLRLTGLFADSRFHPDEALFATFARNAAVGGDWLLPGALDKPPLSIYASAIAMTAFVSPRTDGLFDLPVRAGEIAARLPGALASLLLLPLVYRLAWRLYRDRRTAFWGMGLAALSPLLTAFAPTAFTDGLMLLAGVGALLAAAEGRWVWSGLGMALAFACKQQALYLLPLLIAIGWAIAPLRGRDGVRWFLPFLAGVAVLLLWDGLRGETSLFALAIANNDPSRFIRDDELLPRLQAWWGYLNTAFMPATPLLLASSLCAVLWRLGVRQHNRALLLDVLLLLYTLAYLVAHTLIAFNTYDRYLLLIMPPLLLLSARGILLLRDWLAERIPAAEVGFLVVIFVLVMSGQAYDGARGRMNVGQEGGRYEGIDVLAAYLNDKPLGAIVYDHWLGWELDYYLGFWTDKRRVYYPSPAALVEDALQQPDPAPRYFVTLRDVSARPWLEALSAQGFAPVESYDVGRFIVYRLMPP
jgi:4-amino-4-deoxy-L-arabinose transferase-like glycosyltransferase